MLQFLDSSIQEYFECVDVVGKLTSKVIHTPRLNKEEQRKKWMKFLSKNQGLAKCELKSLGKGLYSWLYRNDREWFNSVTPKRKNGSNKENTKDWTRIDDEMLEKVKVATREILNYEGKPIKLTKSSLRRYLNEGNSFKNKKLIRTNKYIEKVKENNEEYWERKIKWAIREVEKEGGRVTRYKIQIKAGFGGNCEEGVKKLIDRVLYK